MCASVCTHGPWFKSFRTNYGHSPQENWHLKTLIMGIHITHILINITYNITEVREQR